MCARSHVPLVGFLALHHGVERAAEHADLRGHSRRRLSCRCVGAVTDGENVLVGVVLQRVAAHGRVARRVGQQATDHWRVTGNHVSPEMSFRTNF